MPNFKKLSRVLAHNVKMARQQKGFTQALTAQKAKLSLRQFNKIESGSTNPSIETICRLSSVFGMTADELMRIRMIRTALSKEEYLNEVKSVFENEPIGTGVRTLNGISLWGNKMLEQMGLPRSNGEPVELFKVLKGPSVEILKVQLHCEQRGVVIPYINYTTDKVTGDRSFIRYCPTLILPMSGNEPYFVVNYASPIESDCHSVYYRFCDKLLSID